MRDYNHLTRFPAEQKAVLERAREITGLTINELIVRSTHERLPHIVAEMTGQNLAPLPDSAVASAYRELSESELEADKQLGRASLGAQKAQA